MKNYPLTWTSFGKMVVEKVIGFVREISYSDESLYGSEPFERHFKTIVEIGKKLAEKRGADLEVVEVSAWLHDVGSLKYGRKNHHITSAQIARDFLESVDYPSEKIDSVCECILSHRGSQKLKPKTIEAEVIAEADAIDAFNRIDGLFKAALVYENLKQRDARKSVYEKLCRKWGQLSEESKDFVRPKFEAVKLLFGEEDGK